MEECSVFRSAGVLGKKWTLPIMQEADRNGSRGFNYIQRRLRKISPKVLAERLGQLDNQGLVKKTSAGYTLTSKGKELLAITEQLKAWCIRHTGQPCTALCADCPRFLKAV